MNAKTVLMRVPESKGRLLLIELDEDMSGKSIDIQVTVKDSKDTQPDPFAFWSDFFQRYPEFLWPQDEIQAEQVLALRSCVKGVEFQMPLALEF